MKLIKTCPPYRVWVVDPETGEMHPLETAVYGDQKEAVHAAHEIDRIYRNRSLLRTILVKDSNGRRVYACRGWLIDNKMPRGTGIEIVAAGIY